MAWRWGFLVLATLWTCGGAVAAAPKSEKKELPAACQEKADKEAAEARAAGEDPDDDDEDGEGVRFGLAGGCAKLTGGVSYTYQKAHKTAAGLPVIVNKNGTVSSGTSSHSVSANVGLEVTRQTRLGEFKTSVSADWSKATDDGTTSGAASVSGWSVGLGGLTVGYTGTLMSFWSGDFLSSASSPGRGANTIVYEHKLDRHNKVALGLESNLPTTPQANTGLKSVDFSDPVYTMRWLRETDALTLHLSGLVRRADYSASPLLPQFPDTAAVRTGWAGSVGVKLPAKFIADDDEFSFQATYASDASAYLGTSVDLVIYQNTVRSVSPTVGWSAVGSFHHVWSEQFESNLFASFVTVKANLLLAQPQAQTFRTGVNLFWKPIDHLKFGVELGMVDSRLSPNGVRGIFDGSSGRAYIGFLSVSAEL